MDEFSQALKNIEELKELDFKEQKENVEKVLEEKKKEMLSLLLNEEDDELRYILTLGYNVHDRLIGKTVVNISKLNLMLFYIEFIKSSLKTSSDEELIKAINYIENYLEFCFSKDSNE